jgi:phosphoribosylanthranilate isomerase
MVEIKFCGMTRPKDAALAAAAGATHVGVVLAGGPRQVTAEAALRILDAVPPGVRRAAVFGDQPPREIARLAVQLGLDVVQLHLDPLPGDIEAVREVWRNGEVWGALRVPGTALPSHSALLFQSADAVVVEARSESGLGGTGVALHWTALAGALTRARDGGRLILAGGLRPENVRDAVLALSPDMVDVSSGIESELGIKDPVRMRNFADAVHSAENEQ